MKTTILMKPEHLTPYDAINTDFIGQQIIMDAEGTKVLKVVTITSTKTNVEQSFKEMLDVNKLLEPAIKKGLLRNALQFEGEYDDYPNYDFQTAQFQLARANTMFEKLPAPVRVKFNNKPHEFLEFVNNPDNKQAIAKMGLTKGLDGFKKDGTPITPPAPPEPPTPPPVA